MWCGEIGKEQAGAAEAILYMNEAWPVVLIFAKRTSVFSFMQNTDSWHSDTTQPAVFALLFK
jgi:hypothetical protein